MNLPWPFDGNPGLLHESSRLLLSASQSCLDANQTMEAAQRATICTIAGAQAWDGTAADAFAGRSKNNQLLVNQAHLLLGGAARVMGQFGDRLAELQGAYRQVEGALQELRPNRDYVQNLVQDALANPLANADLPQLVSRLDGLNGEISRLEQEKNRLTEAATAARHEVASALDQLQRPANMPGNSGFWDHVTQYVGTGAGLAWNLSVAPIYNAERKVVYNPGSAGNWGSFGLQLGLWVGGGYAFRAVRIGGRLFMARAGTILKAGIGGLEGGGAGALGRGVLSHLGISGFPQPALGFVDGAGARTAPTLEELTAAIYDYQAGGDGELYSDFKNAHNIRVGILRMLAGDRVEGPAQVLHDALVAAPHDAPELYRGVTTSRSGHEIYARYLKAFEEGTTIQIPPASFSSRENVARWFANRAPLLHADGSMATPFAPGSEHGTTSVIFTVKHGSQALEFNPMVHEPGLKTADEWLSGGTYKVTDGKLEIGKDPKFHTVYVELEQVGGVQSLMDEFR